MPKTETYRPTECETCGAPLEVQATGRPRHFCRAACANRARLLRRLEEAKASGRAEGIAQGWDARAFAIDAAHLAEVTP